MRLLIFYLFLPSFCLSQQSIDAAQFFELGLSAYQGVDNPAGEKVNFPWIDQYELRTESRDFDLAKQEYTFRVSPSTGRIRKAQKAFYEEIRKAPDFEEQEIYCDQILSLHVDWLLLFMLQENQIALEELAVLLNDKQSIYEKMMGSYEFDPEKWVKLQTEKSDIEISRNKLQLERDYLLNKYNIQNQEINFANFITVEDLSKYLASDRSVVQVSEVLDVKSAYKKQLLLKEIELESSENKRLIDFVQLKYNGPHTDELEERLSVGLGFQLSNSGNKKLKMQELKLEEEELNRKSARTIQERQVKLIARRNRLEKDLQAYFHFQKTMQEERSKLQILSNKVSQKEGSTPLFLLDIAERNLSIKIKALNKKEALLRDYLRYLHQSNKMCQADFVNYLTP